MEDCYLRINPNTCLVKVMYTEESNLTAPNRDVALLNLKNTSGGDEIWMLSGEAIHDFAESYGELMEIDWCLN